MGGGVRSVGEAVFFGSFAEAIEDDAGLDDGQFLVAIDGDKAVHVAGVVEDDGDIGALAGEAGSCSARKNGGPGLAAGSQGSLDIGSVAGHDDAHGKLTVVRGIRGVEGPGTEVKADVTTKGALEKGLELSVGGKGLMVKRRLVEQRGKGFGIHGGIVAEIRYSG